MTLSDGLNLAVAIGTFSLALAAAYTVASAEYGRRLDTRRRQIERVLDAAVDLANVAATRAKWESESQGPPSMWRNVAYGLRFRWSASRDSPN